ncbi:MAG: RraA family protein [Verrucomicrobia bacterium]|nr:RraA family protein [Verrucomicrobiota bacterium]
MKATLKTEQLEALRHLDTCVVANAIETFGVRLQNEGYCAASVRCLFPSLPPLVGYAVTAKVRCSTPPPDAPRYHDRTDWWNYILALPAPRVVVLQDVDVNHGLGSVVGEVHAHIWAALGCVGVVTNGGARDLPSLEAMKFSVFAGNVTVSHAYSHITSVGEPVEINGLKISPGDLLHGDRHGVLKIPPEIAAEIPAAAARIREKEQGLIALCDSREFSIEKLRAALRGT